MNAHALNSEENKYIDLLKKIISFGTKKSNRTGIQTISLFAEQLKYNLRDTFPILTTRKQYIRGIFEELLFYLRGQTNNNIHIHINLDIHLFTILLKVSS